MAVEYPKGSKTPDAPASPTTTADLRAAHTAALRARNALADKIAAYREDNAVRDIPNTMEYERVQLDAAVESARLALSQAIKDGAKAEKPTGRGE